MKKLVGLFLCAVFVFCGCSVVHEDAKDQITKYDKQLMQDVVLAPNIVINPVLYFLDETGTKFSAETRKLDVPQNERAEEVIIKALLSGPKSENLLSATKGLTYQKVEVLSDVVNVFLTAEPVYFNNEEAMLIAKLAIASTVSDFTGIKYVNVFINDMQVNYQNAPTGALQKTSDLTNDMLAIKSKSEAETQTMAVVLYYLDPSEKFLLPETRNIAFENKNYASAIVKALIRGPENTYNHMPVIDKSIELISDPEVLTQDGKKILKMDFNKIPVVFTKEFLDGEKMALAALANSIIGFIPDISGITIYVNGEPTEENKIYTLNDFQNLKGNSTLLYLPNSSYTLLSGVERIVEQSKVGFASTLLEELAKGPVNTDNKELWPAFPSGVSLQDIKEVYIADDMIVVDFEPSIIQKLQGISDTDEFIFIYSIVNTLSQIGRIKSVQFLVDGQRVQTLGSGILNVIDPILKNPGIIKY
ncbi:MAG: GerMN domain-containing protein [Christensenellaceae bacterium]